MSISLELIAKLREIDTPTICNALEYVDASLRRTGFNRTPLVCPFPHLKPAVGFAKTARIRCGKPSSLSGPEQRKLRIGYYEHVESGARPGISVVQDIDEERGVGAFWGEVQTNIHAALGCLALVTDGSVRDLPMMAKDFFVLAGSVMPSHVHADVVDCNCPVTVAGMRVEPGDLIHADQHGAVVIPGRVAAEIPAAAELLGRREKVILDACRKPGFSTRQIREAFSRMDEIH